MTPEYGGTYPEIRRHLRQKSWQPGTHGKGFVLNGKVYTWQGESKYELDHDDDGTANGTVRDGWPAHIDAIAAVAPSKVTSDYREPWREELATFAIGPSGTPFLQEAADENVETLIRAHLASLTDD